jgi:hypothetical protein
MERRECRTKNKRKQQGTQEQIKKDKGYEEVWGNW